MIINNKPLPLGLHFGLAEERYHADKGIGSTAIRQLARNPQAYWSDSHMNPRRRPNDSTQSQMRGSALHCKVYLGDTVFSSRYICGADQGSMTTAQKSASTKKANAAAEKTGRICLKFDDYARISIAAAMITKNPELGAAFSGGMPEVSLIWEVDGVRCKARFDYIKHRATDNVAAIGDLKSDRGSNRGDLDFPQSCRQAIARYAYAEQASWYLDAARNWIPRYVADHRIFGSDYDPNWLDRLASAQTWAWQWVFYGTEGPPLTWSAILSSDPTEYTDEFGVVTTRENPMLGQARHMNRKGLDNYRRFLAHFGTEQWLLIERPQELMLDDMPPWYNR